PKLIASSRSIGSRSQCAIPTRRSSDLVIQVGFSDMEIIGILVHRRLTEPIMGKAFQVYFNDFFFTFLHTLFLTFFNFGSDVQKGYQPDSKKCQKNNNVPI